MKTHNITKLTTQLSLSQILRKIQYSMAIEKKSGRIKTSQLLAKIFNLAKFKTSDRSNNRKHTIFKAQTIRKKEMCLLF